MGYIMGSWEYIWEVGGCFDALHRYYSLRCLVTSLPPPLSFFLLIDQFIYQFSDLSTFYLKSLNLC